MRRNYLVWIASLGLCACHMAAPVHRPPTAAAAHASAQSPEAVQFAIIGDFGDAGPNEAAVARLVRSWQPDFIVTLGDNNYPRGAAETIDANIAEYYAEYIEFGPNYHGAHRARGASHNRFFPSLGNHDWRTPDIAPYREMFTLPGNGRYYTFGRGPVDFFIVDSDPHEPDGVDPTSKQAAWLRESLAASHAPYKIVVMHHPPYSSGHHGSSKWMHWPYKAWGASIVLAGHDHGYEHIEADGLTYLVNGAGGADLGPLRQAPGLAGTTVDQGYSDKHGALHVRADAQQLTFDFCTVDHERIDTVTLKPGLK